MACPDLEDSDERAVLEVLRSGRLALGPRIEEFERRVAEYVGTRQAVAVSSGTAALHLGARALEIRPGDEVLVPSFTFAASVNVCLYVGARPVFVDVDPTSYTICPADLERKCTSRTRAIVVVDVFGHAADWDAIAALASERSIRVLDDACEALGSEYKKRRVGQFGDAATFGFYPNKQITTGEGGVLVTDNEEIATEVRSARNQGRAAMGACLEHDILGYNYRLDEMSAALGVAQMSRIDQILSRRERIAALYTERLATATFADVLQTKSDVRRSWFVYVVTLRPGLNKLRLMQTLAAQGIPTRDYFPPVHQQPYMREFIDPEKVHLPVTEHLAERTLALPFHHKLTADDVDRVVSSLEAAVVGQEAVRS